MPALTCRACLEKRPLASGEHTYDNPGCIFLSPAAYKEREAHRADREQDVEIERRMDDERNGEMNPWRDL